jgi:hypothetical protein
MSDFDQRWQACASRAREVSRPDQEAPIGFATRVLAHAGALDETRSEAAVWQRLTLRSLGLVTAALLFCALAELPHWRNANPFETGIHHTIGQLVWAL